MLLTSFLLFAAGPITLLAYSPVQDPLRALSSSHVGPSIIDHLRHAVHPASNVQDDEAFMFKTYTSESLFQPPLRTQGRYILDSNDTRLKIASINWYGASDELFIPSGLDVQHRTSIAHTIRQLGFNTVRLPYSDEMVNLNPIIPPHLISSNADLLLPNPHTGAVEIRALEVFAQVVRALTDVGLAVIINNHMTTATTHCGANPCDSAWYNDQFGLLCRVLQTEEKWIENWEVILAPHVDNPLVIGADLRHEVRGLWGTMSWSKWASAAEIAGNRLLRMNPNLLIFVSGVGGGSFLHEAMKRPIELVLPAKVIYEAHVYSWSGWGSWRGTYGRRDYSSFAQSMHENWGFLLRANLAPVLIGELGASDVPGEHGARYWKHLMRYLKESDVDWGYYGLNSRTRKDHERTNYALLQDDWETGVVDYRLLDLLEIMPSRG